MNILELVTYFREGGSFEKFCDNNFLDSETEVVEVYMEKPFNIDKDLAFFEIEKTEGSIEYIYSGVKYYNLFDFYYFLDTIEESNIGENKSLKDDEISRKLFSYSINDA